ncbi:GAF domain-containing protein, partial [Oleiphilus sp. HI0043]
MTTTGSLFETITSIISDLPRDLPEASRYQRLLNNMQNIFPFDAAAVLKLEGSQLRPIAMKGLSDDVLGRRFIITEHPRLSQVIHSKGLVHFEANSDLPDPYDGLIGENNQHPDVHDCMGIPLLINEKPWGLLTLDALEPGTFDQIDKDQLRTFTKLTEAAVKAAERIDSLEASAAHHRLVSQTLLKSSDSEMIG